MNIQIAGFVRRNSPALCAIGGAAVGAAGGYILGRKKMLRDLYYAGLLVKETEVEVEEDVVGEAVTSFGDLRVVGLDDEDAGIVVVAESEGAETEPIDDEEKADEEVLPNGVERDDGMVNVFREGGDDDWDHAAEEAKRDGKIPYVLHVDEFISEEGGYPQVTLTYYALDDVMTDERDVPMYGFEEATGDIKEKFGHGSNDAGIVYIRNDILEMEYEILLHTGSYEMEVLNSSFEDEVGGELEHSDRTFRLRPED